MPRGDPDFGPTYVDPDALRRARARPRRRPRGRPPRHRLPGRPGVREPRVRRRSRAAWRDRSARASTRRVARAGATRDRRQPSDGLVEAAAVVVTAGPWSPGVVDPTGAWRPILPFWGVIVELELEAPPRHVLEEADIDAAIEPDRASRRGRGRRDRLQPRDGGRPDVARLDVPPVRARSTRLRVAPPRPAAPATCRRSRARRHAGCAPAPARSRSTGARSSGPCPASIACSSPPATGRGGSRPGRRPRATWRRWSWAKPIPRAADVARRHGRRAVRRPARLRRQRQLSGSNR